MYTINVLNLIIWFSTFGTPLAQRSGRVMFTNNKVPKIILSYLKILNLQLSFFNQSFFKFAPFQFEEVLSMMKEREMMCVSLT